VSRSGLVGEEAQNAIIGLINKGVTIKVCQCDVGAKEELNAQLKRALLGVPPVRGVIYGAMILRVSIRLPIMIWLFHFQSNLLG
jgi:hypothetical protein